MHKYHWYRKGKAILEIEVYLKKEMYYDMQTSKFKLKSIKHRVHVSFLWTMCVEKSWNRVKLFG